MNILAYLPKRTVAVLVGSMVMLPWAASSAKAEQVIFDLTHPLQTFAPMADNPMQPDLTKPYKDSKPVPSFGQQTILKLDVFPTKQGHFDLGTIVLSEHHGTHLDAPDHYVNDAHSQLPNNPTADKRKDMHDLGVKDLTGPVVLIDISKRIQKELDKNGGMPSHDTKITDFSTKSGNVVTAADIEAVRGKIVNGAWLVLNQGWSRFYLKGPDFEKGPYANDYNYPGLSPAAIDKIIEIENSKNIRINGVMSDVLGVETGENSSEKAIASESGLDVEGKAPWYAHVNGFQRGWKFVENGNDIGQLASAKPDSCFLIVGALKHVSGTGGAARVFAMCQK